MNSAKPALMRLSGSSGRVALLTAFGCAAWLAAADNHETKWVFDKDRKVQRQANNALQECGGKLETTRSEANWWWTTVDAEVGRDTLEAVAGTEDKNIFKTALEASAQPDEITENLVYTLDDVTFSYMPELLIPRLALLLVLILWPVAICSVFPTHCCQRSCCHCCGALCRCFCCFSADKRCGAKFRGRDSRVKSALLFCLLMMLLGIILTSILGLLAYDKIKDNGHCAIAGMLNTTLSESPQFVGLVGLLDILWDVHDKLGTDQHGAWFNEQLANTGGIQVALTNTETSIDGLRSLLMNASNVRPKDLNGGESFHKCEWCVTMESVLNQAVVDLESSRAGILEQSRADVVRLLELRDYTKAIALPVQEMKHAVISTFGFGLSEEWNEGSNGVAGAVILDGVGLGSCLGCAFFGIVFVGLGFYTYCLLYRGKDKDPPREKEGRNPYSYTVPSVACSTWCCGFCFTFLSLLVGLLILSGTVLAGGACLLADDISGESLDKVAGAIKYRFWDEGLSPGTTSAVVDRCLNSKGTNLENLPGKDDLLAIIQVEEVLRNAWGDTNCNSYVTAANYATRCTESFYIANCTKNCATQGFTVQPTYHTLREKISVMTDIRQASEKLATMSNSQLPDNGTKVLMDKLSPINFPYEAMIVTDGTLLSRSTLYKDMILVGEENVGIGFRTSLGCNDYRARDTQIGERVQESSGITSFVDRLALLGEEQDNCHCPTCYSNVACNVDNETLLGDDITIPMMMQACSSGNNLMNLKRMLISQKVFHCNAPGTTGYSCTVNQLVESVLYHKANIESKLTAVNAIVEQHHEAIEQMLLRARRIVGPMEESLVAAHTSCSSITMQYQNVVDAWCYQGVYALRVLGWSLVAHALLAAMVTIIIYFIWRFLIDNVNHWSATYMV